MKKLIGFALFMVFLACQSSPSKNDQQQGLPLVQQPDTIITDTRIIHYVADLTEVDVKFYWKGNKDEPYGNLGNLVHARDSAGESLLFAMNGGMYNKEQSPQGLYIEEGKEITRLLRKACPMP